MSFTPLGLLHSIELMRKHVNCESWLDFAHQTLLVYQNTLCDYFATIEEKEKQRKNKSGVSQK